jgi:hypothetical protein
MVSKCISNLPGLQPPSASLNSHDYGLQVHLQTRLITTSKYIFNELRWVYGDTGVMEVDRGTGSINSADPGVYRHHLVSLSSYYTMKIPTLSFPTFGLTRSVRDFLDSQHRVVSYLLTQFLRSLNHKHSVVRIQCGCGKMCGGVLMVGSLPSSSIVSPQRPLTCCISKFSQWACPGAPPIMLDYHLWPHFGLCILYLH